MPESKRSGMIFDDVMAVVVEVCGLPEESRYEHKPQAAFYQVKGPNGHRLYIAIQAVVRRIDMAFTPLDANGEPMPGIIKPRKQNGRIQHELDTTLPNSLELLRAVLVWMADAPTVVVEKKQAFIPKFPKRKEEGSDMSPEQREKLEQRRMELIEQVAREKGAPISDKVRRLGVDVSAGWRTQE